MFQCCIWWNFRYSCSCCCTWNSSFFFGAVGEVAVDLNLWKENWKRKTTMENEYGLESKKKKTIGVWLPRALSQGILRLEGSQRAACPVGPCFDESLCSFGLKKSLGSRLWSAGPQWPSLVKTRLARSGFQQHNYLTGSSFWLQQNQFQFHIFCRMVLIDFSSQSFCLQECETTG